MIFGLFKHGCMGALQPYMKTACIYFFERIYKLKISAAFFLTKKNCKIYVKYDIFDCLSVQPHWMLYKTLSPSRDVLFGK